jgi:nicotinamide mononucleotide transporter
MNPLSVNTTAFAVLGYPISYIELVGTVLYLWSVWLIAQRRMLTWPVGIVSVLLYMALFYQIRLYADAIEQIYYLAVSIYGWWTWRRSPRETGNLVSVRFSRVKATIVTIGITALLSVATGILLSRVHLLLPSIFPEPASFPYLDAITTVMSFTAMWLLARKRTENWIYWIVIDLIGIGLYYVKGVKFVSLLYVILLALATRGLVLWLKAGRSQHAPTAA